MLKRLELVGFKSFADKTQFDFAAGLTGIVGPNGSGKSNIVDAVRWVLGEQSAKSLRGGEMADVIFNGSTSRRSLGLAEVTMTFDNSRRLLTTDADEVQITRRVYRDGEGEYLINNQTSRLKDIKDLFLGSGAGTDAYCVIEQGRVDVLLQASTKERRTIFEEAAGISRFKARKVETLRKLERVDQNLQRLQDIIDEVEKQLRSVKLQASKAQRYQEYSNRLKELRIALGLDEFQQLSERLQAESAVLEQLRISLAQQASQAEASETEARQLEETLTKLEDAAHEQELLLARARQQIAAEETTLAHEWSLTADLETELGRTRGRMTELNARVAALAESATGAAAELRGVETQSQERRRQVEALEEELRLVVVQWNALHEQVQADKVQHMEQMRLAARLQNDVVSRKAHMDNLYRDRERLQHRTTQAAETLASLDVELQELLEADTTLQTRLTEARQHQAEQRQERERMRQLQEETTRLRSELHAQHSGLASRIEVLERLEKSHEGLGAGVREVLALLEQSQTSQTSEVSETSEVCASDRWGTVVGMIADLFTVRREYAPLIDLALGERAQRFLVRDAVALAEAIEQRGQPFSGRVSFLPMTPSADGTGSVRPNRMVEASHLSRVGAPVSPPGAAAQTGVIALAEQLVTCENPDLADLPAQLLGKTWVVHNLTTARAIAAHASGFRFVTLQGELLEPDGTLTVGTHHAETGILSRKSELRELREQATAVEQRINALEQDLASLRDRIAVLDTQAERMQEEIDVLAEQAGDLRSRVNQHRQRREGLHQEVEIGRTEISTTEQEITRLEETWQQAQAQAQAAEKQVQELQTRLQRAELEIHKHEEQRQQRQTECTTAKVALAQVDERLTALRAKYRQIESDWHQRQQEQAQGAQYLTATLTRLAESQQTMLKASSALATGYLDKETAERHLVEQTRERDHLRQERHIMAQRAQAARNAWRSEQEQAHARELEVNELRHRRDTLVARLSEDYQIDLAALYQESGVRSQESGVRSQESGVRSQESGISESSDSSHTSYESHRPHPANPQAVNEEIEELRRKLGRLGSVNLDSLQELAELETRATSLQTQSTDLTSAKRSLEEIIAKINQDSERLFTETFAAIRSHFQELFRKLFGGGMAEIVMEDEADILESGIEVVARPPGKELRSISLMSGGEKTLTAVALLLAIFRSKPSPFCILDEVDAALDEANIGRFTTVLRDFIEHSQFIIITHSKRTMSAADVLYGITMQESGISKRVAVRFEDWPDEEPAEEDAVAVGRNGD